MRGTEIAQQMHVAVALAPVDVTGGKTTRWLALKNYEHITFVYTQGVAAAPVTSIVVKAAQDKNGTGAVAIPFRVYKAETTTVDLLGAKTAIAAAGFAPANANDIFEVIEVDAAEVYAVAGEGFPYIGIVITNGANSVIGAVLAILSGARFGGDQSPSVNV
jgi:hypothetical protein